MTVALSLIYVDQFELGGNRGLSVENLMDLDLLRFSPTNVVSVLST